MAFACSKDTCVTSHRPGYGLGTVGPTARDARRSVRCPCPGEAGTSGGATTEGKASTATGKVARRTAVEDVRALLDSHEVAALIVELHALRWTGRKGFGSCALVGACLVKALFALPVRASRGRREAAALPDRTCAAVRVRSHASSLRTHAPPQRVRCAWTRRCDDPALKPAPTRRMSF
jgi:hypothetical protein